MTRSDGLQALAALDPVRAEDASSLTESSERERVYAAVLARARGRPVRSSSRLRWRPLAAAAAVALALAIPALAASGGLRSLFGFSNEGSRVDERDLGLHTAAALDAVGARGTVTLLAARGGVGIYAARGAGGERCFFVGPPTGEPREDLSGGCMNRQASASFPSPQTPVLDLSAFVYRPGDVGELVRRLQGVAADGVARMQVLGMDCAVVAEASVERNVYVSADVPERPAAAIVGLGDDGRRVYLNRLRFWERSTCAGSEVLRVSPP